MPIKYVVAYFSFKDDLESKEITLWSDNSDEAQRIVHYKLRVGIPYKFKEPEFSDRWISY